MLITKPSQYTPMRAMKSPILLVIVLCLVACTSEKRSENSEQQSENSEQRLENPEDWSDEQVAQWFDQKDWLGQLSLQPDSSINRKEFAIRYHQHKDRWDAAFDFLENEDLSALPAGNHELDGRNVYAIVSEYTTKNPEEVQFEAHKDYTDLQFVISGIEYIGLARLAAATEVTPYSEERDIAFYEVDESEKLLAHPGTFFIFFPQNAHKPGLIVEDSSFVKKLVIKVKN